MPIYEYECQQCGKVFETIQKFSDPRLTECNCDEKAPVRKLISAAAFHLKGTGWYATDFRDKGRKAGDKKEDGGGDSGSKPDTDGAPPPARTPRRTAPSPSRRQRRIRAATRNRPPRPTDARQSRSAACEGGPAPQPPSGPFGVRDRVRSADPIRYHSLPRRAVSSVGRASDF